MSISEIVAGISDIYYLHLSDNLDYKGFVRDSFRVVRTSSLEINVNKIYSELSQMGTGDLVNGYYGRGKSGKVSLNDALEFAQDVLYYSEFFIKYDLLMRKLVPENKPLFEPVFEKQEILMKLLGYIIAIFIH